MRILIHSNSPSTHTGYGVQTAILARRLHDAGHDVAVSCTYGQQATGRLWEGIQLYPSGYESQGNDIIHNHALHHFGGDPLGGWIIILSDLWVMTNPLLADFNVVGWCPVDHFPVPPAVLAFFKRSGAEPVAMSNFGAKLLRDAGLDPGYVPLSVDTAAFKPTPTIVYQGEERTGRSLIGIDEDVFLVGMTAMNKDPQDRKGFNEAFRAFGAFHRQHPDSLLYVHTDPAGMGTGLNLQELAVHASIPPHAIRFAAAYDMQMSSYTPEMMAAIYTGMDVLLAPSHGEGFGVPLIEAQACGTPVIVTDFSSQSELVGAGWKIAGQPWWDHAQRSSYVIPFVHAIAEALETAYDADRSSLVDAAVNFAGRYDADRVFAEHWVSYLETLEPAEPLELDRSEAMHDVAVVIPAMRRPHNVAPLVESLRQSDECVRAYFVCDPDDHDQIEAVKDAGAYLIISDRGHTFAQKVNCAFENTDEPWLFICGDDVRFAPDWIDKAFPLSSTFDVIGTNDAADGNGNPTVQSGQHADHFFIRRSYVDTYGGSLDGPGTVAHEGYNHFFVDYEIVKLAQARGVFTPCLESVVDHLHPGLGKGQADLVYQSIRSDNAQADSELWESRWPLIEMQRRGRGKS